MHVIRTWLKYLYLATCLPLLFIPSGCDSSVGGGDGGPGTDGCVGEKALEIVGSSSHTLRPGDREELQVLFTDVCAGPLVGESISFEIQGDPGGGLLSADLAVTGDEGKASVTLTVGRQAGDFRVWAHHPADPEGVQFSIHVTGVLRQLLPVGDTSLTTYTSQSLELMVRLVEVDTYIPVPGVDVVFSISQPAPGNASIEDSKDTTDDQGLASVSFLSGTTVTSYLVMAEGATEQVGKVTFSVQVLPGQADPCEGAFCCLPPEIRPALSDIWEYWRPRLSDSLRAGAQAGNPQALYNAQGFTNNLLKAACACSDLECLDQLAEYLLIAFEALSYKDGYQTWTDEDNEELNTLSVSQFLYEVSEAIRCFANLPEEQRTTNMQQLAAQAPVVLIDHYKRWILDMPRFSTHGWGCDGGEPLNLTGALTLSAWVKTSQTDGHVVNKVGTTYQLSLNGGYPAGRLVTDEPEPSTVTNLAGTTALNDGWWHHLALTFDAGSGLARLFVNGVKEDEVSLSGRLASNWGQIFIGGYNWATGQCCFLQSIIDEVAVYDRALSEPEVASLSGCDLGAACNTQGLVSYWSFDIDGTDQVGANHMTVMNGQLVPDGYLGDAIAFNGVDEYASTHTWRGELSHYWLLRGKMLMLLKDSPTDPDFCNAITDTDLWIVAGLIEILAARAEDPGLVDISPEDLQRLQDYLDMALDLVAGRLTSTALYDFDGQPAAGLLLDPGIWDHHPDHAYSGYTGATLPTPGQQVAAEGTGWDISHARRLVHVFETLYRQKQITGNSFPSEQIMWALANQFAYEAFNGDLELPLFDNYLDGTNGWYRVSYHGAGFGYGPHDLSIAGMTGGYGFWKAYNPDIELINQALWTLITSQDPEHVNHVQSHYGTYWNNHVRTGSCACDPGDPGDGLSLLYFLPVFAPAFGQ